MKDGRRAGILVRDSIQGDQRYLWENLAGDTLDTCAAVDPSSYSVTGAQVCAVWRKTKPNDIAEYSHFHNLYSPVFAGKTKPDNITQGRSDFCYDHVFYLVLDHAPAEGDVLTLSFPRLKLDCESVTYTHDTRNTHSRSVFTTQIGLRSKDPGKKGYLSCWLGTGGSLTFGCKTFYVIQEETNTIVYSGPITLQHDGSAYPFSTEAVSSNTPVYEMDYTELSTPGTYRLWVPGVGCSYSFTLTEDAWLNAFRVSAQGLYHQRSGIVCGEPYSTFHRPLAYGKDTRPIYASTCTLFMSGNGVNCFNSDKDNFGNLVSGKTEELVDNAWGGYFDGCDWDRRIQHLVSSRRLLELYLMFPSYFSKVKLSIPESGNGIPDIINESNFGLDCYRRMQTSEGGIRGGIEVEEHPIVGQCSWQDTWEAFAYAPDFWSTFWYIATAARTAVALRDINPDLASIYEESARHAMEWAECDYAEQRKEEDRWTPRAKAAVHNEYELVAVEMFRMTGDPQYDVLYHKLRQKCSYEAAFVYATLPEGMGDEVLRQTCIREIIEAADAAMAVSEQVPYHLPSADPSRERIGPYSAFYTCPRIEELMRAHYLTGNDAYLSAMITAELFPAGANPLNFCYTTGIGVEHPRAIMHHDSRITGQAVPAGITVFGPCTFINTSDRLRHVYREKALTPGPFVWPSVESYLEIYRFASQCEFTVMDSIAPNIFR